MKRLELVFQRLAENGLKVEGSKRKFLQNNVSFLRHIISESGFKVDPEKVRAVERIKEPSSLEDIGAFLTLWAIIKNFSEFRKNSRNSLQFAE